jgi:peptidoglycan/xylan/chitin deacetylase (PgdA/CDA1 family)
MSALEHRYDIGDDVLALTFDDGPSAWTRSILDLLAAHNGRATFFALGCHAATKEGAATLHRIAQQDSEIGNHTFTHPSLPSLADEAIRDELARTTLAIEEASRRTVRYWRPPYSHVDERVRTVAATLGLAEISGSVMPSDWEWDARQSAAFVIKRLRPGSIVCMHDTRDSSVAATGMILDTMNERGLRSVTISELLAAH